MRKLERIDEHITETVELIRSHKNNIDELSRCVDELKEELRELLELYGKNWRDEEGYARIISEGERHTYDSHALDKLILEEPLQYGWLSEYRKTSTTRSNVQVK